MYIEHSFFVGLSDINFNNKLKIKSMLSFLEDAGGIHSNKAGYGLLDIPKKKKSWILLNWKVKFMERPYYAETLRVKTWIRKMDKLYVYRDFEIYNEKKKKVAIATSKWICIDTEKKSIIKIDEDIRKSYTIENKKVFDEEIEKLKDFENYKNTYEIKITRDMIDINKHVHNLNYIDFANQVLPYDVMQNAKNVEVMYKKEIKENDIIKCFYMHDNNIHNVVIKSEDESIIYAIIKIS
jgi:medium-chain acyl-[acyl-carrier-protein] hydrolase